MQAVVLCPTCRHLNAPDDGFCGNCWRRLDGSAALSKADADALIGRWHARRRLIRRLKWAAAALLLIAAAVGLARMYGAFDRPLPPPASDISAVAARGDWPMYLRDVAHSATAPYASAGGGKLKWRFDTAAPLVSTPAVVDGRLYLGEGDNRIVALNAASGALIWERPSTGPVDSSPAVAGNSVFIGQRDGRVLALDSRNGALRWQFQTGGIFATSPVVLDGIVYIGSGDGALYTLDAQTGQRRWTYRTGGHIAADPAVNDEIVAVLSQDGYLHIVDKRAGRKRLDYHAKFARGSPALSGDWVYIADERGLATAIDWHAREVPFEKRMRWLRTQLWAWGFLGELPPLKGLAWAAALPGSRFVAAPIVADDRLYVAESERRLHALDRDTGEAIWTFETDGRLATAPTLTSDAALIGDKNGALYAVDADTGAQIWRFDADAPLTTSPVAANEMIYIASENGSLYALE